MQPLVNFDVALWAGFDAALWAGLLQRFGLALLQPLGWLCLTWILHKSGGVNLLCTVLVLR
jgi:hypothetical protein